MVRASTPNNLFDCRRLAMSSLDKGAIASLVGLRFAWREKWAPIMTATEVKRFQTIHLCGVDVARGPALLFGLGTKALPSWDSRIRWNNLYRGLAVR
jgi:hypothetical protein